MKFLNDYRKEKDGVYLPHPEKFRLFEKEKFIKIKNSYAIFSIDDIIEVANIALQMTSDIKIVAKLLDWRVFERFISSIFENNGYVVYVNKIIKKPRREIDIIAVKRERIFVVDCKHWSKEIKKSNLEVIIEKQKLRTKLLLEREWKGHKAIPLIVTLHKNLEINFEGVPIVSVDNLNNFLLNIYDFLDQILVIE